MVDRYQELETGHVCAYGHNLLKKENISKESNAIEELCDEFVIEHESPYCTEYYLADKSTDFENCFIIFFICSGVAATALSPTTADLSCPCPVYVL